MTKYNQSFKQQVIEFFLQKHSTFFYHLAEKVNKNAEIEQKITEIYHKNHGNYGYRRITLMLRRIGTINHKKVQAIMQKLGLKGKCKRRKYRSYQEEVGKIADNLLERNFQATKPNEKWATLHSDQGWQYQMTGFRDICQQNGIRQSMSRKGNCLDNGAMESFFGRLKTECYFGKRFETFEQLKQTIHDYIHYYNNERIQVKLKGLSPVEYRVQSLN